MREKLVIIGNGMAPGRVLDELFDSAIDRYDITIFNAETRVNYDRIMLSPVLAGERLLTTSSFTTTPGMRATASRCTKACRSSISIAPARP